MTGKPSPSEWERRQSVAEQIAYYELMARQAAAGHSTRRDQAYCLRQIAYLRSEPR